MEPSPLSAGNLRDSEERDQKTGDQTGDHEIAGLFLRRHGADDHEIQKNVLIIFQPKEEPAHGLDTTTQHSDERGQPGSSDIEHDRSVQGSPYERRATLKNRHLGDPDKPDHDQKEIIKTKRKPTTSRTPAAGQPPDQKLRAQQHGEDQ